MLRAATSGRPLIEVIDEGQVDLSSDGIKSFEDSSSSSSLTPIFSDPSPTLLMLWMRATVPPSPPPGYVLSSFSSSSYWSVGSRYEGRSVCAKAKGSRGTASVRQSTLLKTPSGKHVLPQVAASKPKGYGLRRSASLAELDLSFYPRHITPPPPPNSRIQFFNTQC